LDRLSIGENTQEETIRDLTIFAGGVINCTRKGVNKMGWATRPVVTGLNPTTNCSKKTPTVLYEWGAEGGNSGG